MRLYKAKGYLRPEGSGNQTKQVLHLSVQALSRKRLKISNYILKQATVRYECDSSLQFTSYHLIQIFFKNAGGTCFKQLKLYSGR